MKLNDARDFLRDHHRAVLHTARRDSAPQLSPVLTTVDDDGCALVSTRVGSAKERNLRRTPLASLCVFTEAFFGPWVRVDGTAELVDLPEAMPRLEDYYRRVSGEHPDWDDYRRAMVEQRRVLVRVHLEAAAGQLGSG